MLELASVTAGYGAGDVLSDVSIQISRGKIVTLLGANGAGKTTLVSVLSGTLRSRRGQLRLDGATLGRWSATAAVRSGVVLVPEGRHVFEDLTVRDNLTLGAYAYRHERGTVEEQFDVVIRLFPVLAERMSVFAGLLSGGQQQMLAIGRGLMARPKFLLLDEPSLGLAPIIVQEIFAAIGRLRTVGVGVLLTEQNGRAALALADYGYVLERGQVTVEGPGPALLAQPDITDRFLGGNENGGPRDTGLYDRLSDFHAT